MGYIENSYTNSNNGGSVNSQDSLWQMKMAAANNAAGIPAHQIMDRQSNYGYDPITHGGYGTIDDYAPYPHLAHAGQPPASADYNMRGSQNPSRQEYCSDPYASVHKPKKRMDQHIGEFLVSHSITISKSRSKGTGASVLLALSLSDISKLVVKYVSVFLLRYFIFY